MRIVLILVGVSLLSGCYWPTRQERWEQEQRTANQYRVMLENGRRASELAPLGKIWVTFSSWSRLATRVWLRTPHGGRLLVCDLPPLEKRSAELAAEQLDLLACMGPNDEVVTHDCRQQNAGDYYVFVGR